MQFFENIILNFIFQFNGIDLFLSLINLLYFAGFQTCDSCEF